MNKELWKKSVEFHGYECPELAMGFNTFEAAMEKMKITFSKEQGGESPLIR